MIRPFVFLEKMQNTLKKLLQKILSIRNISLHVTRMFPVNG